jgi:replication-associated recombination protein RarA
MPKLHWKGALLVCGEPGTGKSRWIKEEAAASKARIFRWNTRVDRSLREGREILHQQVRSCEPLFVWIEGADDLTQEAQGFLRRILETASPNVVCALEVRELWKMSPPVLSRCTIVQMNSDTSYRLQQKRGQALMLGLLDKSEHIPETIDWKSIPALRHAGVDPHKCIESLFKKSTSPLNSRAIEMLRAIGAGSSPWIQLTQYLMRLEDSL